jgi:hypothetical protein
MPIYEFYGRFNGQVSKKIFLTGDEVKTIITLRNNNRPREVKRLLSYPSATKLILILGPYSGSTATALNVEQAANQKQLILTRKIMTRETGLSVMNQPFWLARVPEKCEVIMKNTS